jgi:hypothetical protein
MNPRWTTVLGSIAGVTGRHGWLALAALFVCALPLLLAAPQPLAKPADPPSFDRIEPAPLAVLGIGAAGHGSTSSWAMLTVLAAGESTLDPVWKIQGPLDTPELRAQGGAATLWLAGTAPFAPLGELALLRAGEPTDCWALADSDTIQRLPAAALEKLRQAQVLDVGPKGEELEAYRGAIVAAHDTAAPAFRGGARTDWAYSDVTSKPNHYRGEVLYVEGRLSSVESIELPRNARERGVPQLYRAVLTDNRSNRYFVRFTELPPGVQLTDVPDLTVSFAGYFLKLVPGRVADAPMMQTPHLPLLVGRSFWVVRSPVEGLPLAAAGLLQTCMSGPAETVAPFTALALLQTGERLNHWKLGDGDAQPRLRRDLFQFIQDDRWIPQSDDDFDATRELIAYYDFLLTAHRTSAETFRDLGRQDVTYSQLAREPAAYRGEVIHVEGTLRRLIHHRATKIAQLGGVEDFYEGWISNDTNGSQPYCVVFTDLPRGLKAGDKLSVPVSFDGYFYKKVKYKSPESDSARALLLVGRRLNTATADEQTSTWADGVFSGFLTFVAVMIVAGIALAFWYVRNDRRARRRLQLARTPDFAMPEPDGQTFPGQGTPQSPAKPFVPQAIAIKPNGGHRPTERTVGTRSTRDGTLSSNEGDTGEPGANAPGG